MLLYIWKKTISEPISLHNSHSCNILKGLGIHTCFRKRQTAISLIPNPNQLNLCSVITNPGVRILIHREALQIKEE